MTSRQVITLLKQYIQKFTFQIIIMTRVLLTIEKAADGAVWGRVEYDDNLIVDSAKSVDSLQKRFRRLLRQFHDVDPDKVQFKIAYDLTSVFDQNDFLNVSAIAKRVGINSSLLRQSTSGVKSSGI